MTASIPLNGPAARASRARLQPFSVYVVLIVIGVSLTWDAFSDFIYVVRITIAPQFPQVYAVLNSASLLLIALTLAGGFAMTMITTRPISKAQALTITVGIVLLLIGFASAVLHKASLNRPFAGQLFYWVTIFLSINLGLGARWDQRASRSLERLIDRFSLAIVVLTVAGYALLEVVRRISTADFYTGYPADQLLLPLAHYIRQGRRTMILLCLALIVVTGKRGALLAALVMLMYAWSRGRVLRAAIPVIVVALAAYLAPKALHYAVESQRFDPDSAIGRPLLKWDRTLNEDSTDLTQVSAGRDIEIRETLKLMRTPTDWLFGVGYGWYFYYPTDPEPLHFVHLSYWNYILTYGATGALMMFVLMAAALWLIWSASIRRSAVPLLKGIMIYTAGFLIMAATANTLSVYAFFWVLFGIGVRLAMATPPARTRW